MNRKHPNPAPFRGIIHTSVYDGHWHCPTCRMPVPEDRNTCKRCNVTSSDRYLDSRNQSPNYYYRGSIERVMFFADLRWFDRLIKEALENTE